MEITDINCMIGYMPDLVAPLQTTEKLLQRMNTYGISRAVVCNSAAINEYNYGNESLRVALQSHDNLDTCYVLSATLDSAFLPPATELYKKLQAERPAAIRLFPRTAWNVLDSFYSGELLDLLDSLAIPVLLGIDQTPAYDALPKLIANYPHIPFVFLGMGMRCGDYVRPLVRKLPNAYFDISRTIDTGFIDEMVRKEGSERFLFGTNSPYFDPTGPISMVVYGDFSQTDKENIFARNWARLEEAILWK